MTKIVVKPGIKEGDDWTWETKVAVATALIDLGNQRLVSELSKVPYDTIRDWRRSDWWSNLNEEILNSRRALLNNQITSIAEKALVAVSDRLENGDYVLNNKTGQIIRKPVAAKDANAIAGTLLREKVKLEELQQRQKEHQESIPDLLKSLAGEFAKFTKKIDKSKASDIEFVERV